MRIPVTDIREGDLIRLSDGTRGEVLKINDRDFAWFRYCIYLQDDMGRIGPHFVNKSDSVDTLDTLKHSCPFC